MSLKNLCLSDTAELPGYEGATPDLVGVVFEGFGRLDANRIDDPECYKEKIFSAHLFTNHLLFEAPTHSKKYFRGLFNHRQ